MSNAVFEAPKVGDGQQMGDGNVQETLNIGRVNQPVQIGNSTGGAGTIGFYGTTPRRFNALRPSKLHPLCPLRRGPASLATRQRSTPRWLPPSPAWACGRARPDA